MKHNTCSRLPKYASDIEFTLVPRKTNSKAALPLFVQAEFLLYFHEIGRMYKSEFLGYG
jgi:hypothetical protein